IIVSLSINLTLFGVAVVYLLLASENLHQLVKNAGKDISFCIWILIIAAVLCPPSMLGTPSDMSLVAVGAIVSTSAACIIIVANAVMDSADAPPAQPPPLDAINSFMAFGTICFAFGGHPIFLTL
ncbi:hypothetical protein EGW08_009440, partial [Elysia chlorotica]